MLIIESIETIKYTKKKRPDIHTIRDILCREEILFEVKSADSNNILVLLIKEGKTRNEPSHAKNSYFILNSYSDLLMKAYLN